MTMKMVSGKISKTELRQLAQETYQEMIKAVVDVQRKVMAVGGELHADAEAVLLDDGSRQEDLWGVNLYPDKPEGDQIEYTALINIRPRQRNRSMEIQDAALRERIQGIVDQRILWEV